MVCTEGAMVAHGRFIVGVGGIREWDEAGDLVLSTKVTLYDTIFKTFHSGTDLAFQRAHPKVGLIDGKLIVMGGGHPLEVIELQPNQLKWWSAVTHRSYDKDHKERVSTVIRSFARTNALNADCVMVILSFLGCGHSVGHGFTFSAF
jgi:hypothetical protein